MSKHKLDEKALKENELISWAERKLGNLKPYWQQIALAVAIGFLGFVAVTYFLENRASQNAAKWQDLTTSIWNTENTRDISDLTYFAQEYPNDPAGLWALQLAGDYELRTGIQQFPIDRSAGLDKVKKAVGLYRQVVDSNAKKTMMLQRRSIFALAYAAESSGDFETARTYYQQVIDEGEKGPFYEAAVRGLQRSSSDAYAAVFAKFRDWEDAAGIAPGPVLPSRPNISFPEIGDLSPASGGDFGTTDDVSQDPPDTPVIPASNATDKDENEKPPANENPPDQQNETNPDEADDQSDDSNSTESSETKSGDDR